MENKRIDSALTVTCRVPCDLKVSRPGLPVKPSLSPKGRCEEYIHEALFPPKQVWLQSLGISMLAPGPRRESFQNRHLPSGGEDGRQREGRELLKLGASGQGCACFKRGGPEPLEAGEEHV